MLKAVAGGGGRGMRAVRRRADLEARSSAAAPRPRRRSASGELYVEELWLDARHVEVQIVGDGAEVDPPRRARLQRPAPPPEAGRDRAGAGTLTRAARPAVRRRGAISRAVAATRTSAPSSSWSRRAPPARATGASRSSRPTRASRSSTRSPRRSPASTWSQPSSRSPADSTLADLGLLQADVPRPQGCAIQLRVNLERMTADGGAMPTGGHALGLRAAGGPRRPGRRVRLRRLHAERPASTRCWRSWSCRSPAGYESALAKAYAALCEFRIAGVDTNLDFLRNVARHPRVVRRRALHQAGRRPPRRARRPASSRIARSSSAETATRSRGRRRGARRRRASRASASTPAIRSRSSTTGAQRQPPRRHRPPSGSRRARRRDTVAVRAPLQGTIVVDRWSARATRCGAARRS